MRGADGRRVQSTTGESHHWANGSSKEGVKTRRQGRRLADPRAVPEQLPPAGYIVGHPQENLGAGDTQERPRTEARTPSRDGRQLHHYREKEARTPRALSRHYPKPAHV